MKGNFLSLVKKESLHILRDKRTMLVVMLIPVVLMVLFGFAISTEVNNVNVAAVAPNRSNETDIAVERLARNDYFTFKGYVDEKQADTLLREHSSFRSGGNIDMEFMQLLAGMKRYGILEQYIDMYEKDLPAQDAEILKGISDELEKDGQKALADHIREWTVEEPEEAQAFDDRD